MYGIRTRIVFPAPPSSCSPSLPGFLFCCCAFAEARTGGTTAVADAPPAGKLTSEQHVRIQQVRTTNHAPTPLQKPLFVSRTRCMLWKWTTNDRRFMCRVLKHVRGETVRVVSDPPYNTRHHTEDFFFVQSQAQVLILIIMCPILV